MAATRLGLIGVVAFGIALVIACGSSEDTTNGATSSGGPGAGGPLGCDPSTCPAGRKCDVTLGCVECAVDVDCTSAGRAPFCILGRCEACRTNADCGAAAPACYPGEHTCGRSCLPDAGAAKCDQDKAKLCDLTTGACVGCNVATDCPATAPICEPTTKSCVTCTANADCPATRPHCRLGRFECVECGTNADCTAAGQICNNDGHCEAGCTSDQQCAASPATPKCNLATHHCAQCLTAAECTNVAGRPICDTGEEGGRCVQCIASADCADAGILRVCSKNVCVQCARDKDCPSNKCEKGACQ